MVVRVRTRYAPLFEVRVLHHFWLDEGTTVFETGATGAATAPRLLSYDVRRLLAVEPSAATAAALAGLRGVFRMTGLGFVVAVPDEALVPLEAVFEFFVTVIAPDYTAYTALTLRPQPITDVADPADARIVHRYKATVPVLSNLTGASRTVGGTKRLFLSRDYPQGIAAADGVEALATVGLDLCHLTGDPPDPPFHPLGAAANLPVYVHQGDVPAISPPEGSTGAPSRGIELEPDTPPGVTAVIRMAARRVDDPDFNILAPDGRRRTPGPTFEIHLRNRWTTWRYRSSMDGSITSTEPAPLPLTHFGNAGTKQKPATDAVAVERATGPSPKITRLVSDIYV